MPEGAKIPNARKRPERDLMAQAAPSILSLSAAGVYLVVVAGCLGAALTAARSRQPAGHLRMWSFIALVFAFLIVMRFTGIEEVVRDTFRDMLRVEGAYAARRSFQRPLAVAVIFGVSGLFAWGLWRQWRAARGRRNLALLAAQASTVAMVMLVGLRIVSLHQLDSVLYGPLKLNWIADLGASLMTLAASMIYVRLVRRQPNPGRR
ncbi:hypothetical protein [Porphyrobacter sp. YT40]|uniref:hypothetical protein n=1 Tax=Porphyrobacter sp. YT40 TaxID=2547601 RepID=UPI0011432456|nr:hypothetical protein [Porphyrobacter sp. YT40]QDH33879.1 hypothetical protein E2E27_05730 [Porphyrobacter sp. YT40]